MILNKYVFNPDWRWVDSILRQMGPFVISRKFVRRWAHALWNLFIKTEEIQGWFGFDYDKRSCEYRLLGLIPIMQFVSFTIWIYSNHDCTVIIWLQCDMCKVVFQETESYLVWWMFLIWEFDPGSERTLAAGLIHASRAAFFGRQRRTG